MIDPLRQQAIPFSVTAAPKPKAANQPVDAYQTGEQAPARASWGDRLARVAAVSATASGVAQLVGLGATATGILGLGVLAAPVAVGLYLCKGGLFRGSLEDKLARVSAISLTGTMAAAVVGATLPVLTALALPALVAAPVAVGVMLWKKLRGNKAQEQPELKPPVTFPPPRA